VLSLIFAGLFTAIGTFDLYIPALSPRLGAPAPITLRVPYGPRIVQGGKLGRLSYEHARVIVPRGTVLREDDDDHRAAFAYESTRRPPITSRPLSIFVIHFILCLMLTAYFRRFGQNRVRLLRTQVGLLGLMTGSVAVGKFLLLFTGLPEFWMPMAAVPLWVALAFDRRTAFLVDLCVAFIAASLLRFDNVLLAVLLVRGVAATLFFFNRKHSRQMFVAGTLGGMAGAVAFVAITVIFEGRFDLLADLLRGSSSNVLGCIGGGMLAGILGRALRDPAERAMGHVSREKLLDLTDLEQPLLKKMAAEAPGSWEHARAMANLAEAASAAIGADALLTRVGAYYHDLGKTVQPKYFVENLTQGERSPHEELDPEVSADAIMAHVVMGTKILRDGHIPEPVVEFAYTHHGTQVVEYFWHKCQEAGNPRGLTEDYFRYPGMKPQTKETAILMLVDSIEAASRTIWPPEQKKFEEMIQRVIFTKLKSGQLDESGLTLEDLRVISTRMATTLVNLYHGRIKYPWQRDAEKKAGEKSAEKTPVAAATASPPPSGPRVTPTVTPSITPPSITPSVTPSVTPSITPSVTPSVTPPVTSPSTPPTEVHSPAELKERDDDPKVEAVKEEANGSAKVAQDEDGRAGPRSARELAGPASR
jgi:hypothetical protein